MIAQENEKPYEFLVKPGTQEWANLTTSKQMDEVCVIPEKILYSLSTKALMTTCLNYPRLIDIFLAGNMQSGFDFYLNHFNGLNELMKRHDLKEVLLQSYNSLNVPDIRLPEFNIKLSALQFDFLELLIAQNIIIKQCDSKEKAVLISEAVKKLKQRIEIGESYYRQRTSALIISRILFSENKLESVYNDSGNDIMNIFNSSVLLVQSSIIDTLLNLSTTVK